MKCELHFMNNKLYFINCNLCFMVEKPERRWWMCHTFGGGGIRKQALPMEQSLLKYWGKGAQSVLTVQMRVRRPAPPR